MNKYHYEVSIEAKTEREADVKLSALIAIAKKLSAKELEKLAQVVTTDPVKTALAKQYLGV